MQRSRHLGQKAVGDGVVVNQVPRTAEKVTGMVITLIPVASSWVCEDYLCGLCAVEKVAHNAVCLHVIHAPQYHTRELRKGVGNVGDAGER